MSSSSIPSYLQDVPALEPPPGITSNLAHPEDKGYVLIIVCSILLFLMILCFSARVYVRFTSRTYVWGDVTCLFAIVSIMRGYNCGILEMYCLTCCERSCRQASMGCHYWGCNKR
ncbi:hypothetical protein sscle_08g062700 [Sclerotinia sclerotiorum 1980 UF-70]|uniref:Uncharacterized protein n=1 Tax=Sclerotinia sclerotiorum (strain ATCC 18683 / 1980 / Ss-1) TaxID=665079 RepID=A0A1D9Q970_SCLS1|nr:hypothetical protein sscle_08g062700 [Sclerotinia sclerotiorum 1980 UF-70]